MNPKALAAEFFGTLWLVLGGCGAAILAADFGLGGNGTSLGLGFVGVSLAFGLTVVTGAYAFGHVSGGHFNPAVTLGLVAGGAFEASKAVFYIIAQVIGAIAAAAIIYVIASGVDGWEAGGFAANGYDNLSPSADADGNGGYSLVAAFAVELVLTAMFLIVILGATAKKAAPAMGGLAIGLCLTLIHLVSIPVTNTSVNPARSTSQAIFADGTDHLGQLWLFWVAPILGAIIGGIIHVALLKNDDDVEIDIADADADVLDARDSASRATREMRAKARRA